MAMIILSIVVFVSSCKKNEDNAILPTVKTTAATNLADVTATSGGFIITDGGAEVTERGVCWGTAPAPTVALTTKTSNGKGVALFVSSLTKMTKNTKYYYRAYATNAMGTAYGDELSFTTSASLPIVSSNAVSNLLNTTDKRFTCTAGGEVTFDGGTAVTSRGVCWGTKTAPTVADNKKGDAANTTGIYTVSLDNLNGNTKYYLRAYVTNGVGTTYGAEITFTTGVGYPMLNTSAVTVPSGATGKTLAFGGGEVTYDGGSAITAHGICWSLNPAPTVADKKTSDAYGNGKFGSSMIGLAPGTKYYVRAYANNGSKIGYGTEVSFTTVSDVVTLWVPGGYQAASGYTKDWDPETAPVLRNSSTNSMIEGYVYFAVASEFLLVPQNKWDGDNKYTPDGEGKLKFGAGSNFSISAPGYYYLNVDLTAKTFTMRKVDWAVIGTAVGGWGAGDGKLATYSIATKKLYATIPFISDNYKFRADPNWSIVDYGDKDGVAVKGLYTLDREGGNDIKMANAGTYTVILDFNTPYTYTYRITSWNIIGSATTAGWNQPGLAMLPSANNKWTITTHLKVGAFKFTTNGDWDQPNYGDGDKNNVLDELPSNDIQVAEESDYVVTMDLVANTYSLTKVTK